jgi:succinoglycan biosynthesis protein ExoU
MTTPEVSVIIAARNAAGTIPRAIRSALREPEAVEVLVVDDGSEDGTSDAASGVDDGSGRLRIHRLDVNRGPSAARNLAIDRSSAPFIAILDADDCYLPGRFRNLLRQPDWDLAADNIMFVDEEMGGGMLDIRVPQSNGRSRALGLDEFLVGNISTRGMYRGELGFLKPVMKRAFLDRHGLRYDERLRLGEDYELYARAMIHGAKFRISGMSGYVAAVRGDSLSGRHRTGDLERLADADLALLALGGLPEQSRRLLLRHESHVRDKYRLRRFLDIKAEGGLVPALRYLAADRRNPWPVARGVALDKMKALSRRLAPHKPREKTAPRLLLPERMVAGQEPG